MISALQGSPVRALRQPNAYGAPSPQGAELVDGGAVDKLGGIVGEGGALVFVAMEG